MNTMNAYMAAGVPKYILRRYLLYRRINETHAEYLKRRSNLERFNSEELLKVVCRYFKTTKANVCVKDRSRYLVVIRQLFHFYANKYKTGSFYAISSVTGKKDHALVYNSISKIEEGVNYKIRHFMFTVNNWKGVLNTDTGGINKSCTMDILIEDLGRYIKSNYTMLNQINENENN